MQGGGVRNGPILVVLAASSSLGHGLPTVPHTMSQITTPSTRWSRAIISALRRVWMPDQAFRLGLAPMLVHTLQITNSSASIGLSKIFVLLPSRQPLRSITATRLFDN